MTEDPKPKKRIPFWVVLIVGTFASCVVMNAITMLFQFGAFKPWASLATYRLAANNIF